MTPLTGAVIPTMPKPNNIMVHTSTVQTTNDKGVRRLAQRVTNYFALMFAVGPWRRDGWAGEPPLTLVFVDLTDRYDYSVDI
jgi:hypothetical protein